MRGDRARQALRGTRFSELRWVEETGSTNRDLVDSARAGAPEGVVLVAENQTAGRGRLDRVWESPPGASLLVSVLVRPSIDPASASMVTIAMAVSAAEACALIGPLSPGIKWPNDLVVVDDDLFGGRKLGGVLAEAVVERDTVTAVVVGLGLNITWGEDRPPGLEETAAGVSEVVGHEVDREAILIEMLRRLETWLDAIGDPDGRRKLLDRYRMMSATIGRRVRVTLPDGSIEGRAVDVTAQGCLVVEVDGEDRPREIVVGDVVHLRHA